MQQTAIRNATSDATTMQQDDLKQAAARTLERLRATSAATSSGQKPENRATNDATNAPDLLHAEMAKRPFVEYRFADDPEDLWHVMLGRAGETFEEAAAACHRQFGAVLTRERETLPDGCPFKRHGDDGEWKESRQPSSTQGATQHDD